MSTKHTFTVSTDGGSSVKVTARSAEEAANEACDPLWDTTAGECFDINGKATVLTVADEETGAVTQWQAFAETSITYWVTQ